MVVFYFGNGAPDENPKRVRGEAKGAHGVQTTMGIYSPCVPTINKKPPHGGFFYFGNGAPDENPKTKPPEWAVF